MKNTYGTTPPSATDPNPSAIGGQDEVDIMPHNLTPEQGREYAEDHPGLTSHTGY